MTITVEQLVTALDNTADDEVIKIQHEGTILYANTIRVENGNVIISSDESEDDDTDSEELTPDNY
jgi:hypothetical protein